MSKVRTRFAPSPTGRMHVGNLRSALKTHIMQNADFLQEECMWEICVLHYMSF